MRKYYGILIVLVLLFALVSIGASKKPADGEMVSPEVRAFYQDNVKEIINKNCNRCHPGRDKAYENLGSERGLKKVHDVIANDKMPPNKPLPPELKEPVLKWLEMALKPAM